MLSHDEDVIIAHCTPRGSGAIALLRISGQESFEVANNIAHLANGQKLIGQNTHTIHYGFVVDAQGVQLDQVLFLLMRGPRSFTGQDTIEITCHNNMFIVDAIINAAIEAGARLAKEGEFSRRAVLNGKIDLLQAEAINELINAQTSLARRQSLAQVEGSLSSWIGNIEKTLIKAYALSEASFEFLDEELSFGDVVREIITKVIAEIGQIQKVFNQQRQIRQGVRVALIGSVNAGKSSLFNALLSQERAIVTNIPGTTRDTIEAGLFHDGNYLTLIDTAGLRKTDDIIEQQGIERSHKEASLADIVLLVVDHARELSVHEIAIYNDLIAKHAEKMILIFNKADLPSQKPFLAIPESLSVIACSCQTRENITGVEDAINAKVSQLLASLDAPFLLNERQFNLILSLKQKLDDVMLKLNEPIQYELLSIHLKDALMVISSLTGKSVSEQAFDAVFKEFCVGK